MNIGNEKYIIEYDETTKRYTIAGRKDMTPEQNEEIKKLVIAHARERARMRREINNLTKVLEDNGLFLINFDFETERVDGMSILADGKFPIVFSNKRSLGDRQRFTLAYELGQTEQFR